MPGQNKTPLIGWHSADPTLKDWIVERAAQAGATVREYLDRVLADHREKIERQDALAARARAAIPPKQPEGPK